MDRSGVSVVIGSPAPAAASRGGRRGGRTTSPRIPRKRSIQRSLPERHRLQVAPLPLPLARAGDQCGALEHLQVPRHRRHRDRQRRREVRDGGVTEGELGEDLAPSGVGQRHEHDAELIGGGHAVHLTIS